MVSRKARAGVAGFLGAVAILGILFWFVGVDRILTELRTARPRYVGLAVLAVLGWMAAWSLAFRAVLEGLAVAFSVPRAFLVFAGALCANNITPFGQAGGEPVTALLLADTADIEYERGLAAIASVDALNFVPSISMAVAGLGYYTTQITFGRRLRFVSAVVVALAVGIPVLVAVAWRRRGSLERRLSAVAAAVGDLLRTYLPVTVDPASLRHRIGSFFDAIERVGTDRNRLALALSLSTLGWLCHVLALWAAFQAIEVSVPVTVLLFAIPVGSIAGVTPLPGGLGGIESVLVGVLVGVGVAPAGAASAVVIYRGLVYWLPTVLGGSVIGALWVGGRA